MSNNSSTQEIYHATEHDERQRRLVNDTKQSSMQRILSPQNKRNKAKLAAPLRGQVPGNSSSQQTPIESDPSSSSYIDDMEIQSEGYEVYSRDETPRKVRNGDSYNTSSKSSAKKKSSAVASSSISVVKNMKHGVMFDFENQSSVNLKPTHNGSRMTVETRNKSRTTKEPSEAHIAGRGGKGEETRRNSLRKPEISMPLRHSSSGSKKSVHPPPSRNSDEHNHHHSPKSFSKSINQAQIRGAQVSQPLTESATRKRRKGKDFDHHHDPIHSSYDISRHNNSSSSASVSSLWHSWDLSSKKSNSNSLNQKLPTKKRRKYTLESVLLPKLPQRTLNEYKSLEDYEDGTVRRSLKGKEKELPPILTPLSFLKPTRGLPGDLKGTPSTSVSTSILSKEGHGGRNSGKAFAKSVDNLGMPSRPTASRWKPTHTIKQLYRDMGMVLSDDEFSSEDELDSYAHRQRRKASQENNKGSRRKKKNEKEHEGTGSKSNELRSVSVSTIGSESAKGNDCVGISASIDQIEVRGAKRKLSLSTRSHGHHKYSSSTRKPVPKGASGDHRNDATSDLRKRLEIPQTGRVTFIAQCPVDNENVDVVDGVDHSLTLTVESSIRPSLQGLKVTLSNDTVHSPPSLLTNTTEPEDSVEVSSPHNISSSHTKSLPDDFVIRANVLCTSANSPKQLTESNILTICTQSAVVTSTALHVEGSDTIADTTSVIEHSNGKAGLCSPHTSSPVENIDVTEPVDTGPEPLFTSPSIQIVEKADAEYHQDYLVPSSPLSTLTSLSSTPTISPSETNISIHRTDKDQEKSASVKTKIRPMARCRPTRKRNISYEEKETLFRQLVEDEENDINDFCHPCRARSIYAKMKCTKVTDGICCRLYYCQRCLIRLFPEITFDSDARSFTCPFCMGTCRCDLCCKRRGEEYCPRWKGASDMQRVVGDVVLYLSEQEVRRQERRKIAEEAGIILPTKTQQKGERIRGHKETDSSYAEGTSEAEHKTEWKDEEAQEWMREFPLGRKQRRVFVGRWDDSWGDPPSHTDIHIMPGLPIDVHAQYGWGKGKGKMIAISKGHKLYVGETPDPQRILFSADDVILSLPAAKRHLESREIKKGRKRRKVKGGSDCIILERDGPLVLSKARKRPRTSKRPDHNDTIQDPSHIPGFTIDHLSDSYIFADADCNSMGIPSGSKQLLNLDQTTTGAFKQHSRIDPILGSIGPVDDLYGLTWGGSSLSATSSNSSYDYFPQSISAAGGDLGLGHDTHRALLDYNNDPKNILPPFTDSYVVNDGDIINWDGINDMHYHEGRTELSSEKVVVDPILDSLSTNKGIDMETEMPSTYTDFILPSIFGEPSVTGLSVIDLTRSVCASLEAIGIKNGMDSVDSTPLDSSLT